MNSIKRFIEALAFFVYNHGVTHLPVYSLRTGYLRTVLRFSIGPGASIHMGCFFTGRKIRIGSRSIINRDCYLDGRGGLSIGTDTSISPESYLVSLTHDVNSSDFSAIAKPLEIGNQVWIGARSLLLPGVRVEDGAVIGAGAIVTRSVAARVVVAGNPARKIGERTGDLKYQLSYFPWFDTDVLP
jgi:acetyltransferase-like isoleucine patch superfamily enzyme